MKPLDGIRVLDLSRLLPGAVCTMMLYDMGAEIIKIEAPKGGDYARWMPPMIDGLGAFFRSSNRGKKSVIIDLKTEQGQSVLYRLVKSSDVIVEGFRPGVTQRLQADYESLKKINARIVYCSLSGWGQDGPYVHVSGHDVNYISLNGVLGAQETPQPLGGQIADVGGSYVGVMGILAALFKRVTTGEGDYIDVALSESAMPFAMVAWVESFVTKRDRGNLSLTGGNAYYRVYYANDNQPMALGTIELKFWSNFCNAVGKPEWIDNYTAPERQPMLIKELTALFKTKTADEWGAMLNHTDCCFTQITPPYELANDPQLQAREMVGVTDEGVPWMRSPIRLSEDTIDLYPAPDYGADTHTVLSDIGYTDGELTQLIHDGIIQQA
jgi:alpha-methylacyl-CoA racemase